MVKAILFGAIVTWCVALVVGSQGSNGGALAVHSLQFIDYKIYWSWPMFRAGTGLSWGLVLLQK